MNQDIEYILQNLKIIYDRYENIQKIRFKIGNELSHNPKNIDLTFVKNTKTGGGEETEPAYITISEICYHNTDNSALINNQEGIQFNFIKDKNVNIIKKDSINCNFYNRGAMTAIYLVNKKDNLLEHLILRVTKIPNLDLQKYNEDKGLDIIENLPDYLYYGKLFFENDKREQLTYHYSIVKKYRVIENLVKEPFETKKIFFEKLLKLLVNLEGKDYLINDLKPENIGYDKDFNPIIIDYDEGTVSKNIKGAQMFWCYHKFPQIYSGVKNQIDGFISFIFYLFFEDTYWKEPWWSDNRCHHNDVAFIKSSVEKLKKKPSTPDNYFTFFKYMILNHNGEGLFANDPNKIPSFKQILEGLNRTQ